MTRRFGTGRLLAQGEVLRRVEGGVDAVREKLRLPPGENGDCPGCERLGFSFEKARKGGGRVYFRCAAGCDPRHDLDEALGPEPEYEGGTRSRREPAGAGLTPAQIRRFADRMEDEARRLRALAGEIEAGNRAPEPDPDPPAGDPDPDPDPGWGAGTTDDGGEEDPLPF